MVRGVWFQSGILSAFWVTEAMGGLYSLLFKSFVAVGKAKSPWKVISVKIASDVEKLRRKTRQVEFAMQSKWLL